MVFCHTKGGGGGGVRGGLTFVTKKVVFFIEGFPKNEIEITNISSEIIGISQSLYFRREAQSFS